MPWTAVVVGRLWGRLVILVAPPAEASTPWFDGAIDVGGFSGSGDAWDQSGSSCGVGVGGTLSGRLLMPDAGGRPLGRPVVLVALPAETSLQDPDRTVVARTDPGGSSQRLLGGLRGAHTRGISLVLRQCLERAADKFFGRSPSWQRRGRTLKWKPW